MDLLMLITIESVETHVSTSQSSARGPVHQGLVLVELHLAWQRLIRDHILSVEISAWRTQTGSRTGTDLVAQTVWQGGIDQTVRYYCCHCHIAGLTGINSGIVLENVFLENLPVKIYVRLETFSVTVFAMARMKAVNANPHQ